jgi:hypothetical protein
MEEIIMKKVLYFTALVAVIGILSVGCEIASNLPEKNAIDITDTALTIQGKSNNDGRIVIALLTEGDKKIGNVIVKEKDGELIVKYKTKDDWELKQTHLAVATSFDTIPMDKKGNPKVNQFPYITKHLPGTSENTYHVDLSDFGNVAHVFIAAHAKCKKDRHGNEDAWAEGEGFPGKNLAMYFIYTLNQKYIFDAFFGNYGQPDEVWFNNGFDVFTDSGQKLDSSHAYCVDLGDLDGDGDLDAFVANYDGEPDTVWFNDGTGKFTNSGQTLSNTWSVGVDLGDVDGDGDLDAYVATVYFGPGNKLWLNDGNGMFSDSGQNLGNVYSLAVDLIDLDGDGDLDAFVSNAGPNEVWLNDGDGIFIKSNQALGNLYSHNTALGDLDGDGDLDAFSANYIGEPDEVWLNNGDGIFCDTGQKLGGRSGIDVELGDLDGDGDLDAFVANQGSPYSPGPCEVWSNDGHGNFTDSGQELGFSTSWSVELFDVDNDGDLDAFVANAGPNELWLNDGHGVFINSGQSLGNSETRGLKLGYLR